MNVKVQHHPSLLTMLAVATAVAGIMGCRGDRTADSRSGAGEREPDRWEVRRPHPTTARASERELSVKFQRTLIKQGRPPLVYMVESPATVSVVNLTTDTTLVSAPVQAQTIVRVEALNGIFFGTNRMTSGALRPTDRFGIFLQAPGGSMIRSETVSPDPAERRR